MSLCTCLENKLLEHGGIEFTQSSLQTNENTIFLASSWHLYD